MDYEEYMRSVLGYNQIPDNIYANTYDNYYYDIDYIDNNEILEPMYPEIYRIIYPMVCKSCNQNGNREITRNLIDKMTDEIYLNMEPEERQSSIIQQRSTLKNGDVRNPNAKESETRGENRQNENNLLRDLIRILILREFGRPNRPRPRPPQIQPRPPMRPPYGQRPPWNQF